jgi:hypothetical protein
MPPKIVWASFRNWMVEEQALGPLIASLHARGVALITLAKREPTLEEVFVAIVGTRVDEVERDGAAVAT